MTGYDTRNARWSRRDGGFSAGGPTAVSEVLVAGPAVFAQSELAGRCPAMGVRHGGVPLPEVPHALSRTDGVATAPAQCIAARFRGATRAQPDGARLPESRDRRMLEAGCFGMH